eukprot:TRINITY_DN14223_c0_g1_i1.p1 TRINITY_DN14223_c0_g1~~TRINITY_DN14223_c0_g1_i1.p1  ORF type:complete len:161 (+),score=6.75 TRINITY_DN14223_c0_g1_i1:58-540(+)
MIRAITGFRASAIGCCSVQARRIQWAGCKRYFSSTDTASGPPVKITFVNPKEHLRVTCEVPAGTNILDAAHKNDIDLEGACEGSLACSTCHVIVKDPKIYEKLGEPSDEENDMLDLAFGLTETSRLGCQVKLTPDISGIEVELPAATRNMAVDGYKPKPH